ncbi:unnamed protein product [Rotaria sp. Silwood2]|nr:unnamed protein product [Rotaria sp. Silwood2]CAF2544115.1 unnamed protein product [Rotaria sp. Silwood2]CAF2924619.1 unnamed protein product [Rotaria sp. Silwood2]CAF3927612.1 unnamed protein product [Rotaria sp. Silwood2]CAF4032880.1 unnamed protein product [Rotaria sp. Silwood2]
MLDDTPCLPDIEQSIDRYFGKLKNKFSMLLTYHPTIDCENGRYLLLNNSLAAHVVHGTGSQLMWYLGVLNVAYALNLILVHLEWTAEHSGDETNTDREKYWHFFDWEIPYSAYRSCPKNSSVKQNIFKYNLLRNQTFDEYHNGKQPFTIKPSFKLLFNHFIGKLERNDKKSNNGVGFTFYSSQTFTIISSLMEVGIVFETRWWLQHRKFYNERSVVWSGVPVSSNYQPTDYFQYIPTSINQSISVTAAYHKRSIVTFQPIQCSSIDIHNVLLIGVHIRHGDVVKRDHMGRIISGDLYRYIENSAYAPLLVSIVNALPALIQNQYLITIYSEGVINDFHAILMDLQTALPSSRCRVSFFLNGRTSETFNRLLRDDIIVGALSTFSMATGIFNSRQLKIGPYHNRARVHGMRNYLKLELNAKHTRFQITQENQRLIKQRIQYVWQQKQAQHMTPTPLWLDNYSSTYPEEFMLI